jgi:hypothetical protein
MQNSGCIQILSRSAARYASESPGDANTNLFGNKGKQYEDLNTCSGNRLHSIRTCAIGG